MIKRALAHYGGKAAERARRVNELLAFAAPDVPLDAQNDPLDPPHFSPDTSE